MTNILVTDFSEFNENISGNSIAQALARFPVFDMTKNITKTAQAIFIKQLVKMFITEYFHYRITFQFGQHRLKIDLVELASQVSTPIESETSLLLAT